jgi:hypothetical protein
MTDAGSDVGQEVCPEAGRKDEKGSAEIPCGAFD